MRSLLLVFFINVFTIWPCSICLRFSDFGLLCPVLCFLYALEHVYGSVAYSL